LGTHGPCSNTHATDPELDPPRVGRSPLRSRTSSGQQLVRFRRAGAPLRRATDRFPFRLTESDRVFPYSNRGGPFAGGRLVRLTSRVPEARTGSHPARRITRRGRGPSPAAGARHPERLVEPGQVADHAVGPELRRRGGLDAGPRPTPDRGPPPDGRTTPARAERAPRPRSGHSYGRRGPGIPRRRTSSVLNRKSVALSRH
jgi:hypothetical protein